MLNLISTPIALIAYITMSSRSTSLTLRPFDKISSMTITTLLVQDISDKPAPSNSYEDNSSGRLSSRMPKNTSIRVKNVNGTNPHTRRQQAYYNPSQSLTRNGMSSPWTSSHSY